MLYQKNGLYDEAEEDCRRALAIDSRNANAFCTLGTIATLHGHYAEADRSFREAIALRPWFAPFRFNLAMLLRHPTVDQRHVQLEDFTIAELLGQLFMRHIIFSDDHQTRGFFIDAMDDAGPYAPGGSR